MKEVMASSYFAEAAASTAVVPVKRKRDAPAGMPRKAKLLLTSFIGLVLFVGLKCERACRRVSPDCVFGTPLAAGDELDDPENLSDVDDEEIESAILNADEVEIRTQLWTELNKEYLEQQEGVFRIGV